VKAVRAKVEEIEKLCDPYVEKGEWPPFLIGKLKELNLGFVENAQEFGSNKMNFLQNCIFVSLLGFS